MDFSLNPAYPTEYRGMYDSDFLPFWNEPVECLRDPSVREVAILKSSQAGGTENVPLNAIRYHAAVAPCRTLYVWGDQKAAEEDFKERILGGLKCCRILRHKLEKARIVEGRLELSDMVIAAAWPKNKMAFKRNPWGLIIADEFSTYPDMTPDMIRKRCDTVPFSHICWISSPDPTMKRSSSEDPIFIEYAAGDQRKWHMADPKSGRLFKFEMGTPETIHGLKWDQKAKREDGTWDMEKVRASAHYVTPDGTRIDEKDRMKLVRKGKWIVGNPKAPSWRRSYHINVFYMPFKSGNLGEIACAFLNAKYNGVAALKAFIYEYLAEQFYSEKQDAKENSLGKRQEKYKRGELVSESVKWKDVYLAKQKETIMTVDVHKDHFWYVMREWIDTGDSGLIDWGHCVTEFELSELWEKNKVALVGIDNRYKMRQMEMMQIADKYRMDNMQWIYPLYGEDNMKQGLRNFGHRDPYEGMPGGGDKKHFVDVYSWHTDTFRLAYLQMLRGESREKWMVYEGVELEYAKQATSTERVDGKWQTRRGYSQDHLFDCECMQLVMAVFGGLYNNQIIMGERDEEEQSA